MIVGGIPRKSSGHSPEAEEYYTRARERYPRSLADRLRDVVADGWDMDPVVRHTIRAIADEIDGQS